jgi:hypothetical protein
MSSATVTELCYEPTVQSTATVPAVSPTAQTAEVTSKLPASPTKPAASNVSANTRTFPVYPNRLEQIRKCDVRSSESLLNKLLQKKLELSKGLVRDSLAVGTLRFGKSRPPSLEVALELLPRRALLHSTSSGRRTAICSAHRR